MGGTRHLADRDRLPGHALDVDGAGAVGLQIVGTGLQHLAGDLQHRLARLLRRHHHRVAGAVGGAAREGAGAVGAGVGIGGLHMDALVGDAEGLGRDLRQHGAQALAEVHACHGDNEIAGRRHVDQRLGGIAAQVHARRIVHGREAGASQLGHQLAFLSQEVIARYAAGRSWPASRAAAWMVSTIAASSFTLRCARMSSLR